MSEDNDPKSYKSAVDNQEPHCSTDKSKDQPGPLGLGYKLSNDNYATLQDIENELKDVSKIFQNKLRIQVDDEGEEHEGLDKFGDISFEEEKDVFSSGNPFRLANEKFTKVTMRRLPPSMTEEELKDMIGWLPEHNYWEFHKPTDWTSGFARPCCWINFLDYRDADWFLYTYNDYEIIDKKGNSYFIVVEYSLNQELPDFSKVVPNKHEGTYDPEEDEEFMKLFEENKIFLSTFEHKTPEEMLLDIEGRPKLKDKVPPLVEFIVKKELERVIVRSQSRDNKREQEEKVKLEKLRRKDKKKERREKERKEKREKEKEQRKKIRDEKNQKIDDKKVAPSSDSQSAKVVDKNQFLKEPEKRTEPKSSNESKDKETKPQKESFKGDSNQTNYNKKEHGQWNRNKSGNNNNNNKPFRDRGERKNSFEQPNQPAKPGPSKVDKKEESDVIKKNPPPTDPKALSSEKPAGPSIGENQEAASQSKKKIVKKIIRVKKVKNGEEGSEGLPQGEKGSGNSKKIIVRVKKVKDDGVNVGAKEVPSTSTAASTNIPKKSSIEEKPSGAGGEGDDKKPARKGKPDMEYYRPARKSGGGRPPPKQGGQGQGGSVNKTEGEA